MWLSCDVATANNSTGTVRNDISTDDSGTQTRATQDTNTSKTPETTTKKKTTTTASKKVVTVSKVSITGAKDIEVGKTVQLEALVNPFFATEMDVTWSSINAKVATVSSKGLVTG